MDEPLIWYEIGDAVPRRWLSADERGSVTAIANDSAVPIGVNSYDEYGIPGSGNGGRFQYTGQTWLPELGMYNYKARIYDPALGRFLQPDPIGYDGGVNLYAYVRNDPVNRTDPSGLEEDEIVVTARRFVREIDAGQAVLFGGILFGPGTHYLPGVILTVRRKSGPKPQKALDALKDVGRGACKALIDADGDIQGAVNDRVGKAIGAGIGAGVGGVAGKASEAFLGKIGSRVGWEIGSASNILGAATRGASTGQRVAGRLGLLGAIAGAAAGAYFAPEIAKFKDKAKAAICGGK